MEICNIWFFFKESYLGRELHFSMGFGVDFFSGADFLFRWGFPMRWHLLRWRRFLKEIMEGHSADPMPSHIRGNPELKCSSWELQICYLSFEELTTLEPNFSARIIKRKLFFKRQKVYAQDKKAYLISWIGAISLLWSIYFSSTYNMSYRKYKY